MLWVLVVYCLFAVCCLKFVVRCLLFAVVVDVGVGIGIGVGVGAVEYYYFLIIIIVSTPQAACVALPRAPCII